MNHTMIESLSLSPPSLDDHEKHNNDSPPMNDDWDVTCSVYADLPKQEHLVEKVEANVVTLWQAHVDMPIQTDRLTCMRQLSSDAYRVWTLPAHQSTFEWRLTFVYHTPEADALPTAVHVQCLSAYPHSWPAGQLPAWRDWLQQQATTCLASDEMSYSVCTWVEHHALEFWRLGLQNEQGYALVKFDDAGPTHYDVPTLVLTFPGCRLVQHATNGRTTQVVTHETVKEAPHCVHPMILDRDAWRPEACPICFEPYLKSEMEKISCGHHVCGDCLTTYLRIKVEDIATHRDNPFRCPLVNCRQGLTIAGCVKQYLTPALMERVRTWIKDMNHPVCHSLPDCLSCKCRNAMRKEAIDSALVYCDSCQKRWCEWCLKRLKRNEVHTDDDCDASQVIRFCERYLSAGPKARERCETKYPWMKLYAPSRMDRDGAAAWLKENDGQQCPVCRTGVERSHGCFHMHCVCGAHFCYECGQEIFYPFYGTHHCWEERQTRETLNL